MNRRQEKVLVATLCGIVIAAAAGFAVQPAMATGHGSGTETGVTHYSDRAIDLTWRVNTSGTLRPTIHRLSALRSGDI